MAYLARATSSASRSAFFRACMRFLDSALTMAVGAMLWSCGSPVDPVTPPVAEPVFQLNFVTDSAQYYTSLRGEPTPPGCSQGPYCRKWESASGSFGGTFRLTAGEVVIDKSYFGTPTMIGDSVSFLGTLNQPGLCEGIHLEGRISTTGISGNWLKTSDCHGLTRAGHFTGSK